MSNDRACPTAPGATVGRRRGGRGSDATSIRVELAIEAFNASRESRMVAGLVRTLGEPLVSVGAAAGSEAGIRITIAWDLSWYQWTVDGAAEQAVVRRTGSGGEQSQLDGSARMWNAGVTGDGRVFIGRPPRDPSRRRRLGSRLRLR